MNFVILFWKGIFVKLFSTLWVSIVFWRAFSFISLGIIIFAFIFRESLQRMLLREDAVKHDRELFKLLDLVMSERKLLDVLEQLEKNHSYDVKSCEYIDKFLGHLQEESRQYVLPKIKKSALVLAEAIKDLRKFINDNFVLFPDEAANPNAPGRMFPNPSIDGGGSDIEKGKVRFQEFVAELNSYVSTSRKHYQKYRSAIKQSLQV